MDERPDDSKFKQSLSNSKTSSKKSIILRYRTRGSAIFLNVSVNIYFMLSPEKGKTEREKKQHRTQVVEVVTQHKQRQPRRVKI
jgi:hypothetical protein